MDPSEAFLLRFLMHLYLPVQTATIFLCANISKYWFPPPPGKEKCTLVIFSVEPPCSTPWFFPPQNCQLLLSKEGTGHDFECTDTDFGNTLIWHSEHCSFSAFKTKTLCIRVTVFLLSLYVIFLQIDYVF